MNSIQAVITVVLAAIFGAMMFPIQAEAQLDRKRVVKDQPVQNIFWSARNIGISTVKNPAANNLHSSVLHTFGLVDGGIDRFFGLDDGANTRLGLIYGITDRVSLGLGRMTFQNVVDIHSKINILRQTETGSMPIDLAVKADVGISTLAGTGLDFSERLSYYGSLMIARKFDRIGIQLAPMYSHFNRTVGNNEQQLFGLGILLNAELNDRFSLSAEYLPVFGDRNPGTEDAMAVAVNINTGGHVFQIFFASSQWHNEQYIMANNRDRFWEGDFRFGFNINRVFWLGGK